MRITGRLLRPSNLAERRTMLTLGLTTAFRVPRSDNPYALARKLRRLAEVQSPDVAHFRKLVRRNRSRPVLPAELPDSTSEPRDAERAA